MARSLLALTVALAACAVFARADDDDDRPAKKTSVEPVSLSISRKLDDKDFPFYSGSTYLSLKVSHAGKEILGIDSSKSKVSEWRDDQGNSMLGSGLFKPNFSQGSISRDRGKIIVSVSTSVRPAKGSAKLTIKGEVALRCGYDVKTTDSEEVELKLTKPTDTPVKIDGFALRVTQEKAFFGTDGATISLTTTRPGIKSLTIKDEDGKAVDYSYSYSFSGSMPNQTVFYYNLRRQVKKVTMSVTYFNKVELVTVPINASVGLGL